MWTHAIVAEFARNWKHFDWCRKRYFPRHFISLPKIHRFHCFKCQNNSFFNSKHSLLNEKPLKTNSSWKWTTITLYHFHPNFIASLAKRDAPLDQLFITLLMLMPCFCHRGELRLPLNEFRSLISDLVSKNVVPRQSFSVIFSGKS